MALKTEIRTFRSGSLRSSQGDEGSMVISGRALSYNVLSQDLGGFKERIARGAFSKCLATNPDVLCRREHESGFLLGRTSNGTLKLQDTPDGLDFQCAIDPRDPIAVSTHAAIRSGLLDSMSFAFAIDGSDGDTFDTAADDDGKPCVRRTVKRALIMDVAPVCQPAYKKGTTVSARSCDYNTVRSTPVFVPRPQTPAANAEMRKQIESFDKKHRHDEVRRLFAQYPELSLEHIAQCRRLGYSEDVMLQLRGAEIAKRIREGRAR